MDDESRGAGFEDVVYLLKSFEIAVKIDVPTSAEEWARELAKYERRFGGKEIS